MNRTRYLKLASEVEKNKKGEDFLEELLFN